MENIFEKIFYRLNYRHSFYCSTKTRLVQLLFEKSEFLETNTASNAASTKNASSRSSAMNPSEFVLVVIQVDDAAVFDRGEFFHRVPIYSALHFYRANHIFRKAAFKPFLRPFEKPLGIANHVAENPIAFSDLLGRKRERIVRQKFHAWIFHQTRVQFRAIHGKNARAQIRQNPSPSARRGSAFKTSRSHGHSTPKKLFASTKASCNFKYARLGGST